jgi:tape measure domain-containing protein
MNSDNGKIGFSIELDNSQLNRDIKKSQQAFRDLGDQVESECSRMDNAFSGISRSVASIGAAWSLQELGKNVATIRGEFQSLQKTMEVMLQSKSKAEALMAQMVQTAATTPFGLQEVAGGAKQLIAYGLEADKVNDTLIQLGNIASGLKIPLGDLIYLYGTTMAQGRLYTQDLNQFTGRGIPMIKELAEHFGVAESKVKGLVEEGKVGFPEVQAVINDLTGEGGKFFNLMAEQSTLINGKISNLEDAFDSMFNKIGQSNEGVINDTIDTALLLVENYELVGDVLMTLVADYGVYKATLMAVTAYTNACYNYEIAQLKTVVAEKGAEIDADLASAVSKGRMTAQRAAEVQALRQEIAAKIEAATVTERVAQAELAQATMKYESFQVTVSLSKMRVAQAQQELAAAQASGDATAIESAKTNLNTAIKERNNVARQSSILKRNLETASTNANAASQAKATLVTKADTAAKKIQATTTSLLTLCTNGLSKAFKALTAAMAKNPFGLILVAVTTVLGALMTMNDAMEETSEEVERFGESAVKQSRNVETLLAVINNTSTTSKVHKDAVNELIGIYKDYGIKIDDERSKLDQLNQMREEAIRLIRLEGEERQKANLIASYEDALNSANEEMRDTLQTALAEAEWDGSGMFDDWDYDKLQDDAKQMTIVIGGIMQAEAEELAKLTGDAYEERLKQAEEKIKQAYKDLGYDISKTFTHSTAEGTSYTVEHNTDVNEISILESQVDKIRGIVQQRQQLIESINNSKSAVEEETEAVDYEKLSFDELFDAAYKAKEKVAEVGTVEAKPAVNTSSIDNAISRTETLLGNIELLGGMQMPNWNWSNFSTPTTPTEYLGPYRPGYTPALPTLPSANEITTPKSDEQQQALIELDRRIVEAIKTRKGTSELLKEVNSALETAEAGSADEKRLLAIQQRLQNQQKKFKTNSGTGETPAQRAANIERAELEVSKAITNASNSRMALQASLKFQEEQHLIDLETDAIKKRKMQRELDNKKELYEIEQQKQAAINAEIQRQKAIFDAQENEKAARNKKYVKQNFTDDDIDQNQIAVIEAKYQTLNELVVKQQAERNKLVQREDARAMNEYLKDYGTYLEKRNAIIALYNEQIANATSEGEKLSLAAQMREDLSELDIEANKTTAAISQLFGDMTNKTVADMRKIADAAQNALDFLIAGEWDEQKGLEFGMTKETFDTLRKSPEELEKIRKGIRECREEADAAEGAFKKMGNGLNKLFAAGNDAGKTKQALSEIESGLNDVLQLGSFLSDTFSSLGDAFGSDALSGVAEGINVAMDAASSAMSGAQAGAMFGPWGAAAGAAIGLVSSLASSIAKLHDAKHEKKIQKLQDQIEILEKNYEKLGRSVEKAYSKDASKMIEQQNTLLAQQKLLIQQQIQEEKDKKKTDWGRIEEWENQIEEIDQLIADNKEKAVDAIFGEDLKSAIDNFSSAYAEAWASGGDKAKSAKEVVKKMMQQMVTESIKAAIQSSGKMEEIRQKLQQFYADNVLSGWEQDYIYNMAEQLQAELDEKFGWADGLMGGDDESQREGVKKGIATASQESVDENNARLTTMQGHTYTLVQNSNENKAHLAASREHLREIRELANTSIKHLEDISRNTYQLYETNKRLKRVEDELSDINTKGVVIRKA